MLLDFEKAKPEDKTKLNQEIKKLRSQLVAQQQQVRASCLSLYLSKVGLQREKEA